MHENAEILHRAIDALNSGDMETLQGLFAENAAWYTPGKSIFSGGHIGREPIFRQFARYGELTGGTFKRELLFAAADDAGHAMCVYHCVGERDNKSLDVDGCMVVEIKDGQIADGKQYFFDLYAWDKFWS